MIILTFIQILPFCFIAHSTHLCQPLDVVIFSMMQRSYGKLVLRTRKEGITITKAFFSKLLKEVRDEVLRPAVITGSFSTCGYFPFSFPLSYAFKQMPPPQAPSLRLEVVAVPVDKIQDETALTVTPELRSHQFPSHLLVIPVIQPIGKQNTLGYVRQHMHALEGQATPRRVANIRNDMLHHAHKAMGQNATIAALVDVIHLQTEVIEGQGARQVMDNEYANHLKGQLANRTKQKDRGTILKYGHGAMTTEVLRDLIDEQNKKEADELEAAEKRDEKKEAAKKKKAEEAMVKETKKTEKAAEKERKELADAEKKQIKAARMEKARQAVATKLRGKGRGMGRGGSGRGPREKKAPKLDSMSTSDDDKENQLPPVKIPLDGLSTTSHATTSTVPAPPEPAVVRSRSGRPIRAPVR